VFDRDGADAMRWFLMSSPILRGGNLVVTEQAIRDGVRQTLIPLWNAWSFFTLYANAAGVSGAWSTASQHVLDRYLLAGLRATVADVQTHLDRYDIASACDAVQSYTEILTNWYIRRSRERFWSGSQDAINTLYTALEVLCRTAAPLLPLVTEDIWRGLTGERSVHLTDWPSYDELPDDPGLVERMERAREVCSVASSIRKASGIRARQPLQRLTIAIADPDVLRELAPIIAAEVNVRDVALTPLGEADAADAPVSQRLTVSARAAGPRLGRDVQTVIKASKSGDWSVSDAGVVVAGGIELVEGEYTLETTLAETASASALLARGGFVVLDTTVTPELAAEGTARDVIRSVQQARRDAGLEVTDRIRLSLTADAETVRALEAHRRLIIAETLADEVTFAGGSEPLITVEKIS
jgi:isoleucyl-tRNA synthetase